MDLKAKVRDRRRAKARAKAKAKPKPEKLGKPKAAKRRREDALGKPKKTGDDEVEASRAGRVVARPAWDAAKRTFALPVEHSSLLHGRERRAAGKSCQSLSGRCG